MDVHQNQLGQEIRSIIHFQFELHETPGEQHVHAKSVLLETWCNLEIFIHKDWRSCKFFGKSSVDIFQSNNFLFQFRKSLRNKVELQENSNFLRKIKFDVRFLQKTYVNTDKCLFKNCFKTDFFLIIQTVSNNVQ